MEIDLTSMDDTQLRELVQEATNELRLREIMKNAELESHKIAAEAEAKRQQLAETFIIARDKKNTTSADDYPEWVAPSGPYDVYPFNYQVVHNGKLWRNVHNANSWEPGTTNSQWIEVQETPDVGPPPLYEWGVGQSVSVGDKRTYNGRVWQAKISHITHEGWAPSEFTHAVWLEIGAVPADPLPEEPPAEESEEPPVDPQPEPEPEPTIPEWSAQDRYEVGDKVVRNGIVYECLVAHGSEYQGTWGPPAAAVWKEV